MLPATFELAFAGHRTELTNKMKVTLRLLNTLLDRDIITRRHYYCIKVSASLLMLHSTANALLTYATTKPSDVNDARLVTKSVIGAQITDFVTNLAVQR